jgi:hypothetical protein
MGMAMQSCDLAPAIDPLDLGNLLDWWGSDQVHWLALPSLLLFMSDGDRDCYRLKLVNRASLELNTEDA